MSAIAQEDPIANAARFQRDLARILVEGQARGWQAPTVKGLLQLLLLAPDWNSHGARAIDAAAVWAAWQLLTGIMEDDSPAPSVVPTMRGGVQLEWHRNGIDLEIEVARPQQCIVSFEAATGESWEKSGEIDLAELRSAVRSLSPQTAAEPATESIPERLKSFIRRLCSPTQETPSDAGRAVLDRPVSDLQLSAQNQRRLDRLGITTLGELIQRTEEELLEAKNLGMTSLAEVREGLARFGLKLRKD